MKKLMTLVALSAVMASMLFGQAATDGFIVPLDEDLSNAVTVAQSGGEAASGPSLAQGIWIETTSDVNFLIRDIATGEKSGFEIDSNHFKSNANWWFWGDIGKFHLDAEIAVWNFDKVMFKANSYGGNVPDVTFGDGLQSLIEMFFSLPFNGNDDGLGSLNKIGLNLAFPYVEVLAGYGGLKANGMSEFEGIYNVIDRWPDVGKGFTELRTGKALESVGDFSIKGVAALSMMRGTYGMYDILDVGYRDFMRFALTFGSRTTAEQLFYYNTADLNALSAYFSIQPISFLKAELHGIGTFGQDLAFGASSIAGALRVSYMSDVFTASLKESYAGADVHSVWGSDGQAYDNINADNLVTDVNLSWSTPFKPLTVSAGLTLMLNDVDSLSDGLMTLRMQPVFDLDLNELVSKDITAGLYGVFDIERLATATSASRNLVPYMDEAGIELVFADAIPFVKKLKADYGFKFNYSDWNETDGLKWNACYNSIMLSADITERINVHAGSVIRVYSEKEAAQVPFGFAVGAKFADIPLPGHPFFWVHACYGMNPYEDNNYSLYRADDELNKPAHRTYLLNSLDQNMTKSQISLGLVWSL